MRKQVYFSITILLFVLSSAGLTHELNPGDGIRVTVYNLADDEVSGDFFVQQDSTILFPYIGTVSTGSSTVDSIRKEIVIRYQTIYRDLEIAIQPLYKVNVLGEVDSPDIYYVTGIEELSEFLAMAGGETDAADISNIFLIRDGRKVNIDAEKILHGELRLSDLGIKSNDDIYVPRKRLMSFRNASVLLSAAALVVTSIGVFTR